MNHPRQEREEVVPQAGRLNSSQDPHPLCHGDSPPWPTLYRAEREHDACGIGFVARVGAIPSRPLVEQGLDMLCRMKHRGASGSELNTGDGAGLLVATPDAFLRRVAREDLGIDLPAPGHWAAGNVFLPHDESLRTACREELEQRLESVGLRVAGWRTVPVDPEGADLGSTSLRSLPFVEQIFVVDPGREDDEAPSTDAPDPSAESRRTAPRASDALLDFDRRLYVARKLATHALRRRLEDEPADDRGRRPMFCVCSLAARTLVYKGMLLPAQLQDFYPDLQAADFASHLAMIHSRFSTNTFPSWDRAQPNRCMSHNGEINTLRGNVNWMSAREGDLAHPDLDPWWQELLPVIDPGGSDSGAFDNVLEFLTLAGRPLPETVMMMVPEAWQGHEAMDRSRRAFYAFHSNLMEPWDGPASIAFTDGRFVGAVLDRNGLRPSRFQVTDDGMVVMASEVGVVDLDPARVVRSGRLEPGRMFLVDFDEERIVEDEEIKLRAAARHPYAEWLRDGRVELDSLPSEEPAPRLDAGELRRRQQALGYTEETIRFMLRPLVESKRDPVGSMGNDAALACLSDKPRLVYDYFKQLFAQVTNPAIDSIREEIVMSVECPAGPESNLLDPSPASARRLHLEHPILTPREMARVRALAVTADEPEPFPAVLLDATWPAAEGEDGLQAALLRLCREADEAVRGGAGLLVLTDRACGPDRVAVPALLACGAVHQSLLRSRLRTRAGLVVESGEAREVHHHCLLLGYGADAIHPWLALETLWAEERDLAEARSRDLPARPADEREPFSEDDVLRRYRLGVRKGMLKVMAKMGISTLQSYKGAQIFEAVGVGSEVMDLCFTGSTSRLGGVDFRILADEALTRHREAWQDHRHDTDPALDPGGEFHWRSEGEDHMWSPAVIASLQDAARSDSEESYWKFAREVNETTTRNCALRGLLRFRTAEARGAEPVPLDEVESAQEIVRRFCTGAMSFGSISAESHESLAVAMNRLGGKSNTGEGGEDEERFKILPNGDSRRSAIKQVASGRFGVTGWYLLNADEIQIKIAQGAKPGEGGELPGYKVDEIIAATRHSTPGVGLISPPPHHDIYSIEDLKQLIHDLKNANPEARISVKLVSETGVGTVAAGVVKGYAEHVLVSGHDGGTGASPLTSIKHAGLPWELGLAETHQTLVLNGLRERAVLQTDGQLKTGRDVLVAALLGAEEFGFSTAPLITLGCIMMRKCHLNTCPVGIATQDPELRARFQGRPEHVVNYLFMVAEDARRILASLGLRRLGDAVGRSDLLEVDPEVVAAEGHPRRAAKAALLDLQPLLEPARSAGGRAPATDYAAGRVPEQHHGLERALDHSLIERARPLLSDLRGRRADDEGLELEVDLVNTHRTVGTLLSREILQRRGPEGLPADALRIRCRGSAGQSFGAFLAPGVLLDLEGQANDYVGKGLSGGRIVVRPPRDAGYEPEENIVLGNVALYGATSGDAFFRGIAAERFCVRNSGARAVVEGVGDHACEYMTGGRAVILGATGRNFAAGMSGGVAWVLDRDARLAGRCNHGTVILEPVDDAFREELHELLRLHLELTGSPLAEYLLVDWPWSLDGFVQVMPKDFRKALRRDEEQRSDTGTAVA